MEQRGYRRARRALAAATVAIFAVLICMVAVAVSPSEDWVQVEGRDADYGIDYESLTLYVTVSYTVEVVSNMPYDIDGIDVELYHVDNGSGMSLITSVRDTALESHGSTLITLESRFSLYTILGEVYDIVENGDPLHLRLDVTCSYMLGLLRFTVTSDIYIPVTEEGTGIDVDVTEDTGTSYAAEIRGLEAWLLPESREFTVSGGGMSADVRLEVSGRTTTLAISSDEELGTALPSIASSDDLSATDPDGNAVEISGTTVYALYAAVLFLGWLRWTRTAWT